jgi:hypothetical protein
VRCAEDRAAFSVQILAELCWLISHQLGDLKSCNSHAAASHASQTLLQLYAAVPPWLLAWNHCCNYCRFCCTVAVPAAAVSALLLHLLLLLLLLLF